MLDIPERREIERAQPEAEVVAEAERPAEAMGEERAQEEEPQGAAIVVGAVFPDQLEVNGVLLTEESFLTTLRTARAVYEISRSGGRSKRYRRLVQHQKKLEMLFSLTGSGAAPRFP